MEYYTKFRLLIQLLQLITPIHSIMLISNTIELIFVNLQILVWKFTKRTKTNKIE